MLQHTALVTNFERLEGGRNLTRRSKGENEITTKAGQSFLLYTLAPVLIFRLRKWIISPV